MTTSLVVSLSLAPGCGLQAGALRLVISRCWYTSHAVAEVVLLSESVSVVSDAVSLLSDAAFLLSTDAILNLQLLPLLL